LISLYFVNDGGGKLVSLSLSLSLSSLVMMMGTDKTPRSLGGSTKGHERDLRRPRWRSGMVSNVVRDGVEGVKMIEVSQRGDQMEWKKEE
jgi:hypothetical protein